jgi:TPR repeat protein
LENELPNIDASRDALVNALATDNKPEILMQLKVLAENGQPKSFAMVGDLYEFGANQIAPKLDLAYEWYRRSVYEENDFQGYFGLARFYRDGKYVERDLTRSAELFREAFNRGSMEAAIVLGHSHINGCGVGIDLDVAEKYLSVAADSGYAAAYFFLSKIELARGHYFRALKLWWTCIKRARKLTVQDPKSDKLYYLHGALFQ